MARHARSNPLVRWLVAGISAGLVSAGVFASASPQDAAGWEALAQEYDALGLPWPADDAPLAAMFYDMELIDDRDFERPLARPRYLLGFVVDGGEKRQKQLLIGTEFHSLRSDGAPELIEMTPEKELPGRIVDTYEYGAFEIDVALPTAVQCYRRGWKDLADKLLSSQSNRSYGHPQSVFHQSTGLTPAQALRYVAWTHWGNQLADETSDRSVALRRMSELIRLEPGLNTPARRALVDSLAAAIKPRRAARGSDEDLVDQLVELNALYFDRQPAVGLPTPLAELAKRGWEAMPTLLAHLDDRRLTRSIVEAWDGSAAYLPQVGELVGNLVQELAGDQGRDWQRTPNDHFIIAEPARQWWKKVQSIKEDEYLVKAAIPVASQATSASDAIVARLAHKYPNRLLDAYRKLLAARLDLNSWNLVSAIASATIDPVAKDDALTAGASCPNVARQAEALEALAGIDFKRFETLLLKSLQKLPADTADPYAYCGQVALAQLCWKTGKDEIWTALRTATARADVGVRMEIIKALGEKLDLSPADRARLIELLAAFLDDETLRSTADNPAKYEYCAAHEWPRLEVRNWAAYQLARLLGLDVLEFHAASSLSDEDWARLRREVAERLR